MTTKKSAKKESKSDYEVLSKNLKGYKDLLVEIKKKAKSAQIKAAVEELERFINGDY